MGRTLRPQNGSASPIQRSCALENGDGSLAVRTQAFRDDLFDPSSISGYQLEQLSLLEQAKLFSSLQTFFLSVSSPWAYNPFWHQGCGPLISPLCSSGCHQLGHDAVLRTPCCAVPFFPAALVPSSTAPAGQHTELFATKGNGFSHTLAEQGSGVQDFSNNSSGSRQSERQPSLDCPTLSTDVYNGAAAGSEHTDTTTSRQLPAVHTASCISSDNGSNKRKRACGEPAAQSVPKRQVFPAPSLDSAAPLVTSIERSSSATDQSAVNDEFDMLEHLLEHGTCLGLWADDLATDAAQLDDGDDLRSLLV
ncbi:hypothetical protein QJQ45_018368 [Haematococcus lacustris]|nr:hypothetical protein QJQ45_018368 [Haematococcus lacustris]